jgi:hypothetical protein
VINTGPDPEGLYFRWNDCYTLDDLGRQTPLGNNFVLGDGRGQIMQPGLPVGFSLVVDNVDQGATQMNIILGVTSNKFPLPMERVDAVSMKKLPIVENQP